MTSFGQAIQGVAGQPASIRVGVVESVSPLVVTAQGVPFEDVGLLNHYTPQEGDSVILVGQSSDAGSDPASWVAMGSPSSDAPVTAQAGRVAMSVTASNAATQPVVFDTPFSAPPAVSTNLETGDGASFGWGSRAINVSTTGFTAFIFGTSSTFAANLSWQAQAVTQ